MKYNVIITIPTIISKEWFNLKEITLEITNKCNYSCLHCSTKCGKDSKISELSIQEIKNLLDKYQPQIINISGGEPMLHPQINGIINMCNEYAKEVNLYTTKSIPPILWEKVSKIVCPLHSLNKNKMNFMMNSSEAYENITKTLNDNCKSEKLCVHIVPTSINIDELYNMVKYVYKNAIQVRVIKLIKQGNCSKNDFLMISNIKRLDEKIKDLELNFKNIKIGNNFRHDNYKCDAGKNKLVIKSDGSIIPCESFKDGVCNCKNFIRMED